MMAQASDPAYTRSDPYLQSVCNTRKLRRRWLIAGASSVILVVVVVCVVFGVRGKNSKGDDKGSNTDGLQTPCQTTSYPQTCVTSLASYPNASSGNPREVGKGSLWVTLQQLYKTLNIVSNITSQNVTLDVNTTAALGDCFETLESAVESLNSSLLQFSDNLSQSIFNDLITLVSAALTDQTTCLDSLENLTSSVLSPLQSHGQYNQELLSNSLAILNWFFKVAGHLPSSRKLLSFEEEVKAELEIDFPGWVSMAHRKLMQSSSVTPNVVVDKNGGGQYKTIQDAIKNAPLNSKTPYVIKINAGTYEEQVIVPKKAMNLVFVGDGMGVTIITGSRNVQQSGVTTFTSATVIIQGKNFLARDLTIQNTAGPNNHQAVALRVSADFATFYKCSLEGAQDTLYTHTFRQFYRECNVIGTVDFIFGNGAVVLQSCTIFATVGTSGQFNTYTAQGKTDKNQNTGLAFINCQVTGTAALKASIAQHATYLGRPWKPYSTTVFINSYLDSVVHPSGWTPWSGSFALKTLFYGEYGNTGPGASRTQRVSWSTGMTLKQATPFGVTSFIQGNTWIPSQVPYSAGI